MAVAAWIDLTDFLMTWHHSCSSNMDYMAAKSVDCQNNAGRRRVARARLFLAFNEQCQMLRIALTTAAPPGAS